MTSVILTYICDDEHTTKHTCNTNTYSLNEKIDRRFISWQKRPHAGEKTGSVTRKLTSGAYFTFLRKYRAKVMCWRNVMILSLTSSHSRCVITKTKMWCIPQVIFSVHQKTRSQFCMVSVECAKQEMYRTESLRPIKRPNKIHYRP